MAYGEYRFVGEYICKLLFCVYFAKFLVDQIMIFSLFSLEENVLYKTLKGSVKHFIYTVQPLGHWSDLYQHRHTTARDGAGIKLSNIFDSSKHCRVLS